MADNRMTDAEFGVFQIAWAVVLVLGAAVLGCRDNKAAGGGNGAESAAVEQRVEASDAIGEDAGARAGKRYLVYRDEAVLKSDVASLPADATLGDLVNALTNSAETVSQ